MCAIAGLWRDPEGDQEAGLYMSVAAMAAALRHRGPDDSGVWTDSRVGVALGHRRLAIVDLSPAGHQPLLSASRRYVIVFNGEIYNHRELRRELQLPWRG